MSFTDRFPYRCSNCHKPIRLVYGSAEWHERNDPPGGYCRCTPDWHLEPDKQQKKDSIDDK